MALQLGRNFTWYRLVFDKDNFFDFLFHLDSLDFTPLPLRSSNESGLDETLASLFGKSNFLRHSCNLAGSISRHPINPWPRHVF